MVATYRWMEQNRCRGDKAEKGGAGSRKDDDGREETDGKCQNHLHVAEPILPAQIANNHFEMLPNLLTG